jgi:cell division protein FtsW
MGEELGFIVSAAIIVIFMMIFLRGVKIARNASDDFGFLLASGLILLITIQALINISAIIGLLPLTGIPLPFVSLGGTNIVVLLAALGIVLNVSRFNTQR